MERARRLFALDQNFPTPIVKVLRDSQAHADLVPIRDIDERMSVLDDWELLLALHHHEQPWDGLVTTDSKMLRQERELATLIQTTLTLVTAEDAGHNPVKAAGLLFAHLESICRRTVPGVAQAWTLRAAARAADDPWDRHLQGLAKRRRTTAQALFQSAKLSPAELASDPLASRPANS